MSGSGHSYACVLLFFLVHFLFFVLFRLFCIARNFSTLPCISICTVILVSGPGYVSPSLASPFSTPRYGFSHWHLTDCGETWSTNQKAELNNLGVEGLYHRFRRKPRVSQLEQMPWMVNCGVSKVCLRGLLNPFPELALLVRAILGPTVTASLLCSQVNLLGENPSQAFSSGNSWLTVPDYPFEIVFYTGVLYHHLPVTRTVGWIRYPLCSRLSKRMTSLAD